MQVVTLTFQKDYGSCPTDGESIEIIETQAELVAPIDAFRYLKRI